MGRPIASVAVAGDGIAALTVAATLVRRVPGVAVTLVSPPEGTRSGLGDRMGTVLPAAVPFLETLGIGPGQLADAGGGGFRLATRLCGWGEQDWSIGWGGYGDAVGGAPLHQLWLRDPAGSGRFAELSPAAMLAEAGRFAPPGLDARSPFADLELGVAVDPERYRALLGEVARQAGVRRAATALAEVEVEGMQIAALRLGDGQRLLADLYVDASGPDALLLAALPGGDAREDWSGCLPVDRVMLGERPADPALPPLDTVEAEASGWRLTMPLRARTLTAHCYSSRIRREAAGEHPVRLRQGRRVAPWIGNCVAVGDAAVEVEPLFHPHLALLHAACARIVALLPDSDFAAVELALYAAEAAEEADHLRDYIALAYRLNSRREPWWRRARAAALPPMLADRLALFARRGRLLPRDRETFGLDQWLALMLDGGVRPAQEDALAGRVTQAAGADLLRHRRVAIAAAVAGAPPHAAVMARAGRGRAA